MGEVMVDELQFPVQRPAQRLFDNIADLSEPHKENLLATLISPPICPKSRLAKSGRVGVADKIDCGRLDPGIVQAEANRVLGKHVRIVRPRLLAVLDAIEPFLLAGCDDVAINDQRGG